MYFHTNYIWSFLLLLISLGNQGLKKDSFYLKVYYEKNLIIQWNKMYNISGKKDRRQAKFKIRTRQKKIEKQS